MLVHYLRDKAHEFEFTQLVRLLERLAPQCIPVGEGVEPHKESVRFRSNVSLAFPPSDIHRLLPNQEDPDKTPVLEVNFLGLAGHFGPLPQVFTEWIRDRISQKDFASRDFLDIFNHRLLSLLVRIHKKHAPGLEIRSPARARFSQGPLALLGLGAPTLQERQQVDDRALLGMAGLLMRGCPTAVGLVSLVASHFSVKVEVSQFQGAWMPLERDQLSYIRPGNGPILGRNAVVGRRVWDQHGGFKLIVGPLDPDLFASFLPDGNKHQALRDLIRFYVGFAFRIEVVLKLETKAMSGTLLSASGKGGRLGWTSWLKARQLGREPQVSLTFDYDSFPT